MTRKATEILDDLQAESSDILCIQHDDEIRGWVARMQELVADLAAAQRRENAKLQQTEDDE